MLLNKQEIRDVPGYYRNAWFTTSVHFKTGEASKIPLDVDVTKIEEDRAVRVSISLRDSYNSVDLYLSYDQFRQLSSLLYSVFPLFPESEPKAELEPDVPAENDSEDEPF